MANKKYHNLGIFLRVAERIRKIRGNMTQKMFAQKLGVKQNAISRYESGRIPDLKTLNNIAVFGNVTVEWLLRGVDQQEKELEEIVPGEYDPKSISPIETALLAEAIVKIEEVIKESRLKLDIYQRARLIARVYEECRANFRRPSHRQVQKILLLVD
jgi:transcriptional regulator with XRE-family HTH domain